jgi:hypothetical protein
MRHPETPFRAYLASIGDAEAARILGITRRTAKSWRLGYRQPRPTQAREIVTRTPWVSMSDIYGSN